MEVFLGGPLGWHFCFGGLSADGAVFGFLLDLLYEGNEGEEVCATCMSIRRDIYTEGLDDCEWKVRVFWSVGEGVKVSSVTGKGMGFFWKRWLLLLMGISGVWGVRL